MVNHTERSSMLPPISSLKKSELVWLSKHRCKHKHTYLEHYSCYLKENPNSGNIGFFDIETSNLSANMGVVLAYCIKDSESNTILGRTITKKELFSRDMDKALVRECISDLKKFDRIVTYYGTRFDIPFVRTRAMYHNLSFPGYGEMIHTDLYYTVKHKFKLTSNKLVVACKVLLGEENKTPINYEYWIRGLQGNKEALKYILTHCQYDVLDLERLYEKIILFKRPTETSA